MKEARLALLRLYLLAAEKVGYDREITIFLNLDRIS
jgi:hypothetical protein